MSKKILIDLTKCRNCDACVVECVYEGHPDNIGIKELVEMASFSFTCRRCEDAPCINVCPVDALEKNTFGIVSRSINLCISCKSCIVACPFGTLMNSLFDVRKPICNYCNLSFDTKDLRCVDTCQEKALELVDFDEDESKNIYRLNDKVLVKEYAWEKLKQTE